MKGTSYPVFFQLADHNIGCSRDTSFEQLIMSETNGRGVDLVLNTLSAEQFQASVRCLAPRGRFLEIGGLDLANNTIGMILIVKLFLLLLLMCSDSHLET
jgi:fatty acid synthase